MDYYKILNLDESATLKEIEQAYSDLSSFYNPENNFSKSAYKRFREVNEAYNVLKDLKQREIYNLSKKESLIEEDRVSYGKKVGYHDFEAIVEEDLELESELSVSEESLVRVEVTVPYFYKLLDSYFTISYFDKEYVYSKDVCKDCLGKGKVRKQEKIVVCPSCLGKGKQAVVKEIRKTKRVKVTSDYEDNNLRVSFNFINQDECKLEQDTLFIRHVVSEEEYHQGICYVLESDEEKVVIENKDFLQLNQHYEFNHKKIIIDYLLSEYKGKDLNCYLVSDEKVIYLNPLDYTYRYLPIDNWNYKVVIDSDIVVLKGMGQRGVNQENGDLIVKVIRVKNVSDLHLFFDYEIKKVSAGLFRYKGFYNGHFIKNSTFEYDDRYLYLPSKAYKLKMKSYLFFKVLFVLGYLFLPLILFLCLGLTEAFFVSAFISLFVYLIGINFLMEVRL